MKIYWNLFGRESKSKPQYFEKKSILIDQKWFSIEFFYFSFEAKHIFKVGIFLNKEVKKSNAALKFSQSLYWFCQNLLVENIKVIFDVLFYITSLIFSIYVTKWFSLLQILMDITDSFFCYIECDWTLMYEIIVYRDVCMILLLVAFFLLHSTIMGFSNPYSDWKITEKFFFVRFVSVCSINRVCQ